MKRRLQTIAPAHEQPTRPVDSPYLTSQEALAYLKLRSLSALYSHMRDNGLPYSRLGRALRFDRRELDVWMRDPAAFKRDPTVTAARRLRVVGEGK